MKDNSGVIVSALLMLFGAYALTTLRSGAEEVTLIGDIPIDWRFALVVGLIGLFGGVIVLSTTLSKRRTTV